MDLPLAQLRSLLVSKICLLGSHRLTKTHCFHHMFESWTALICWESLMAKETTHIKHSSFPLFHRPWKMSKDGAKDSNLDLGTPPWALGTFAVSIHVPLSRPKMRLEQCSLRQRMLLEKNLQSTQCQIFELDTTPRSVGQLKRVQAKVAP